MSLTGAEHREHTHLKGRRRGWPGKMKRDREKGQKKLDERREKGKEEEGNHGKNRNLHTNEDETKD